MLLKERRNFRPSLSPTDACDSPYEFFGTWYVYTSVTAKFCFRPRKMGHLEACSVSTVTHNWLLLHESAITPHPLSPFHFGFVQKCFFALTFLKERILTVSQSALLTHSAIHEKLLPDKSGNRTISASVLFLNSCTREIFSEVCLFLNILSCCWIVKKNIDCWSLLNLPHTCLTNYYYYGLQDFFRSLFISEHSLLLLDCQEEYWLLESTGTTP